MTKEELAVICKEMNWPLDGSRVFNPIINNNRAIEIICKIGISIQIDSNGDGIFATVWDTDISIHEMFTDEDRPSMVRRLICKAAYEHLKEK
jgi:hypothetical protein